MTPTPHQLQLVPPVECEAATCEGHPAHEGRVCAEAHHQDEGEQCGCYGPCLDCLGRGGVPDTDITCRTCTGSGRWPWPPDPTDQERHMTTEPLFEASTLTGSTHPPTSWAAARKAVGRAGSKRYKVLAALWRSPRTDEELQARTGIGPNTERPRRVELVRLGYVEDSGATRPTADGNASIVWRMTEAGLAALRAVEHDDEGEWAHLPTVAL